MAGALYAFSPAVFSVHLSVLAEPLYLVLSMAALALIADRRGTLGGCVAAAAVLTRYAGLRSSLRAISLRGRERLKFLATSLTVYHAWMARNESAAGKRRAACFDGILEAGRRRTQGFISSCTCSSPPAICRRSV